MRKFKTIDKVIKGFKQIHTQAMDVLADQYTHLEKAEDAVLAAQTQKAQVEKEIERTNKFLENLNKLIGE